MKSTDTADRERFSHIVSCWAKKLSQDPVLKINDIEGINITTKVDASYDENDDVESAAV